MEAGDLSYGALSQILRTLALAIDAKEEQQSGTSLEHRRLRAVQQLLAGERVDAALLTYNFACFHGGVAVHGPDPHQRLDALRQSLDSRLLIISVDPTSVWAWLGGNEQLVQTDLNYLQTTRWPKGTAVGCGEPAQGLEGWRLTHRQALAALPIAQGHPTGVISYPDVALLATALHDDLLSSSLRQAFLAPLEEDRDGGQAAKDTLRAYFKARRNASSAAAVLGVNRATVRNRLTAIEDRLGRSPDAVSAELEVALQLDLVAAPES